MSREHLRTHVVGKRREDRISAESARENFEQGQGRTSSESFSVEEERPKNAS
jgi:hypothetical protein